MSATKTTEQLTFEAGLKAEKTVAKQLTCEPASMQWYTIEELASLCGYELNSLKHWEKNLSIIMNEMSINIEVNTKTGGYHNTKKFYSENVLKALKEYQVRNAVPNAVKDKKSAADKMMTTKELAERLGTKPNVITENAKKCIPNKKIENGKTTYWNEQEATVILECIKNNKVGAGVNLSNHLIGVSTELTPALKIKKAMELMQEGYEEELAILRAKNAEMQPKALVYDRICNADGLKPVEQVASNLGWGKNNFFALMRGMGVFFYSSRDADGRKTNLPKREYVERGYFVTKEEPYTRGDKDRLYTKIYVTGKGETWLARKIDEAAGGAAEKWIEREA